MTHHPIDAGLLREFVISKAIVFAKGDPAEVANMVLQQIVDEIDSGRLSATPPGDCVEALRLAHEHMQLYLPHYRENHNVFDAVNSALTHARPAQGSKHDWINIETGNWYSVYECSRCKAQHTEQPEDICNAWRTANCAPPAPQADKQ